ncbi:protein kinase domain-containing protein [Enorma massiliensis]|uniref:protein kinase domain-containing protein n=1 Tax=Enorma massiliensis TaxID=1472761 RepID=UPI0032088B83
MACEPKRACSAEVFVVDACRCARFVNVYDAELLSESARSRVFRGVVARGSLAGLPCVYKEFSGSAAYLRHHDALLSALERAQANAGGGWRGAISGLPRMYGHALVTLPDATELLCCSYAWVEGTSLARVLVDGGASEARRVLRAHPANALSLAAAIARAVAAMHDVLPGQVLVHQDIKPSNIVVSPLFAMPVKGPAAVSPPLATPAAWDCTLIDIDLAYAVPAADGVSGELAAFGRAATVRDSMVREVFCPVPHGTPGYAAPECVADESTSGPVGVAPAPASSSDVFSLAVVIHELLAGTLPYSASQPEPGSSAQAWAGFLQAAEQPIALDPNLAPEVSELLASALSFDPSARPAARVLAEGLERTARCCARVLASE